jgi:hypothetical protein
MPTQELLNSPRDVELLFAPFPPLLRSLFWSCLLLQNIQGRKMKYLSFSGYLTCKATLTQEVTCDKISLRWRYDKFDMTWPCIICKCRHYGKLALKIHTLPNPVITWIKDISGARQISTKFPFQYTKFRRNIRASRLVNHHRHFVYM